MTQVDRYSAQGNVDLSALRGEFDLDLTAGRIRCRVTGFGPPVVLVHGNTFDLRMWTHVHDALTSFTVISYDLRGYGKSSHPESPYSHVNDLHQITNALTGEPFALVGLSMGGRIAIDFALTYPDQVNQLVLVGSGIGGWIFDGELADIFESVRAITRRDGWEAAQPEWLATALLAPTAKHPAAWRILRHMVADYTGWHYLHDDPVVGADPPALTRLACVEAETLVMTGSHEMKQLARMSARILRDIPDSRHVMIDHCGHLAPLEQPEVFTEALLAFLCTKSS